MEFNFFSYNGRLKPIAEAVIPLSNIEYSYGFGVYETIRVVKGVPYFLSGHFSRLQESAKILSIEHPFTDSVVEKSIMELIEKNGAETYNLKILLIGAPAKEGAELFIQCLNPHFPDKKLYRDGASFITYTYERTFPQAKTLNMLQSYLAYREAKRADAYDALLLNKAGFVTEGTRTNFFCIHERTIVTPPERDILLGVTRKAVLKVALEHGFTLEERDIRLNDIQSYDGAFVTSTSSKIVPVREIDGVAVRECPTALRELMQRYEGFLDTCGGRM